MVDKKFPFLHKSLSYVLDKGDSDNHLPAAPRRGVVPARSPRQGLQVRPREWRQDGALSRMVGMVLLAWNPSAATNYLCCILGLITYPPVPGDHIH